MIALGKAKGDYFAIAELLRYEKNKFFLKGTGYKISPSKMIDTILRIYIKYLTLGVSVKIAIETIAFQEFFKDKLKEEALKKGIILSVCELKNKVAKELRIDSLAPYINDSTIIIDSNSHLLIEELLSYPKAAHDDLLDASEMAFRVASYAGLAVLKQLAMSKNISYLDNLSVPPIIAKTDNASDTKQIEDLLEQLSQLRSASVGIFSKEDALELLNSSISTSTFTEFLRYCDEAISKLISGQVLAGNSVQNGTQALGTIHEEVRNNVGEMDTLFLAKSVQKILENTLKLNFAFTCDFEFVFDTNKEIDEQYLSSVYTAITNMGYEIPVEFIAKTFKIEGLKKKEPSFNEDLAFNSLVLEKNQKMTQNIVEKNAKAQDEVSDEIYEKIKQFWQECNSYEELEERIFKEYPNLSFDKLKESLDKKITQASIQALFDVGNE